MATPRPLRPVRILLTGFAPFGGSRVNPSWEAVRRLRRARIAGVRVSVARLPVVWGEAERRLVAAIRRVRPDAVICTGQSSGRAWVSVETRAVNRREGRDDSERLPRTATVWERASARDRWNRKPPNSLPSTLPVRLILAALRRAGIPARRSRDAGRYLCNAAMYTACWVAEGTRPGSGCRGRKAAPTMPSGFIHVPMLPGQAKGRLRREPTLPLRTILRAVRIAVRTTAWEIRGKRG